MDKPREEIYERIPWETLEDKSVDKQWLTMGIAAAVVAGALAYSYMSNRPAEPPPAPTETVATVGAPSAPAASAAATPAPPPVTTPPANISEADLYALDSGRLIDEAVGHARWFVREFLAADTSSDGSALSMLLPADVPLPVYPDGVAVFVEWVESLSVEEVDLATYRVEVLARYMISIGDGPYERVPPEIFLVEVTMVDGNARVLSAPQIQPLALEASGASALGEVPPVIAAAVEGLRPEGQIVGGVALLDGSWSVVVMTPGPGEVLRPEAIVVSAP